MAAVEHAVTPMLVQLQGTSEHHWRHAAAFDLHAEAEAGQPRHVQVRLLTAQVGVNT